MINVIKRTLKYPKLRHPGKLGLTTVSSLKVCLDRVVFLGLLGEPVRKEARNLKKDLKEKRKERRNKEMKSLPQILK